MIDPMQNSHFSPKMKMGRWIGVFRELTQSEEEDAWAVHERRQLELLPVI